MAGRLTSARRVAVRLASLVVLAGSIAFAAGLARLCTAPLDVGGTTRLPAWAVALKSQDDVAYPAHAVVGTLLDRLACNPAGAGLQWLKAAAHARTSAEVERSAQGLAAAKERSESARAFDASVCQFVTGALGPGQRAAAARAGLPCGESA